MNNDPYLKIMYDKKDKPQNNYPNQLASFLCNRFNIEDNMNLLDLGCGRGDFLKAFRNQNLHVKGADLIQDQVEDIKIKNFNFSQDPFPYKDNSFDVIFTKSVIEHIEEPNHFLSEAYRTLKKNGLILVMCPEWFSQMYIFYNDYTHIHPYNVKSLKSILQATNFSDVDSELFYQHSLYWHHPQLKRIANPINRFLGPVKRIYKNKFIRFSRELMVLAHGRKK
jgi:SAM-dependent methyltransferase